MEDDVAKALAYQVKRDLAERYFSFRRLIEEDSARYFHLIQDLKKEFEEGVGRELVRLYCLLRDEDLIKELLPIVGFSKEFFYDQYYDPYVVRSFSIKARLFEGFHLKGWTHKGRFKNLVFEVYQRLAKAVDEYLEKYQKLEIEAEVINEEIKRFREKFDLSEIMQFLKGLELPSDLSALGHPSLEKSVTGLEKTLEFNQIPPPQEFLPQISPLPSLDHVRKSLTHLAKEAYRRHKKEVQYLLEKIEASSKS